MVLFSSVQFSTLKTCHLPGHEAQSVTCLTTDVRQTADPGVPSSATRVQIPARSHTFEEIDHEIISTLILPNQSNLEVGSRMLFYTIPY